MSEPAVDRPGPSATTDVSVIDVLVSLTRPWTLVVCLRGAHDAGTVQALCVLADDQLDRCDRLAIDLTHATSLGGSVLDAIVDIARRARPRGVTFHVVAPADSPFRGELEARGVIGILGCVDCLPEMQATHAVLRPDGSLTARPPAPA